MKYIDPYDFLKLKVSSPDEVDAATLAEAKKRLLAEFEFSADGMLAWQGASLSKSEAIAILEQLEDPALREGYWKIRQLPGMRILLRDHKLSGMLKAELAELPGQPSFQQMVLPLMLAAFSQVLRKALSDQKLQEFGMVLNLIQPFSLDDEAPLWEDSLRLLDSLTGLMQESAGKPEARQRIMITCGSAEICAMLNRIPYRFQAWRDAYGVALAKLVVANYRGITSNVGVKQKMALMQAACIAYRSLEISAQAKASLQYEESKMASLMSVPAAIIGTQPMPQIGSLGGGNGTTSIIMIVVSIVLSLIGSLVLYVIKHGR